MQKQNPNEQFLYIPNIIDYFRALSILVMLFCAFSHPIIAAIMYVLSQVLDAFDGIAARKYNQCTTFGQVFDMVCDRFSDAVILAILAILYREYAVFFLVCLIIDMSSHWFQQYAAVYCGEHHKQAKTNWKLLRIYYGQKKVMFTLILGYETFAILCYLLRSNLQMPPCLAQVCQVLIYISFPIFLAKNVMSIIQLFSASEKLAQADFDKKNAKPKQQ